MFKVKNNESGKITEFDTIEKAIKYQEYLVFDLGIDAEIL
jgi:hypothetical protein